MPTVEFHGFSPTTRKKILAVLRSLGLRGTLIFSIPSTHPKTALGKRAPFLRVYTRFPANVNQIRKKLGKQYDIEFVRIQYWPRKRN